MDPSCTGSVSYTHLASVGETLIGLKIQELEEKGLSFDEVVEQTEAYIISQDTWFVLENLDTDVYKRQGWQICRRRKGTACKD